MPKPGTFGNTEEKRKAREIEGLGTILAETKGTESRVMWLSQLSTMLCPNLVESRFGKR